MGGGSGSMAYEHTPVTVDGKAAVVIGGTSGIGEAIALGFAEEGADVVATSRSEERVTDTAEKLSDRGATTAEVPCDVTDRDSLERLRDETLAALGDIDILVTSQGVIARDLILDLPEADWNQVLDVQLTGVYRACQVFAPPMHTGSIVVVTSMAPTLSMSNLAPYMAAKGGANAFTRAAAKEFAPDIRVNALAPGFVITPLNRDTYAKGTEKRRQIDERTPLGRVADREEMVGAAVYLASDASSFTTGAVFQVDGGFARSAF